jgi:hypothetical protein
VYVTDDIGLYDSRTVAAMTGRTHQAVRKLALRHGFGRKIAGGYVFTPAEVEAIRAIDPRGGRPTHKKPG